MMECVYEFIRCMKKEYEFISLTKDKNSYYRVGVWIHRINNDKSSYVCARVWIHIIDKKYEFILYIRWCDKRKDWLTSKTIVDADAAAAAGEVVNATTSAKAAADINDECLRGLSAPAGNVTSEGGGVCIHGGCINSMVQWGTVCGLIRGMKSLLQRYEVTAPILRLGAAMTDGLCWWGKCTHGHSTDVASVHAVIPK